ncbi:hypothetical protein D0T25_31605 [Duganella sp. BJB488]|uniref:hypothetical protein n=1 Tax=unclassified Duganella TaxID=2636909 RepID=UPI000E351840|nr:MULTISPECIES: hypothetical protein [unclassified Duganella]RFP08540.1 hypothetical protein D0T26_31600 [Duganella sp. BJB489]RFP11147.1 hypothetical protein D0T25_31605 [Duganella sp. BJB488]RFP28526.1 hypothetical protein D0T24_31715 [Duganella sp. BJB480]
MDDKLTGPVAAIIDKHRTTIAPMLAANGGAITRTALQNDTAVRTVAGYCYQLLPGLIRLAVKEPAFIEFVMTHREQLLNRLVEQPAQQR